MEEEVGKFPQAVAEIYNSLLAISLPFSVCVVAIDRLPNSFSLPLSGFVSAHPSIHYD